jgi:methionyl-tRNA formyltransferase
LGLRVEQPERVRRPEVVEQLRGFAADAMVVVGYGQIIPQAIIDLPKHGIINVHGSLLPKYRGAAPIQWAIARGEKTTGVTTMKINAGLDTGDMLLKWSTEIGIEETAVDLGARLSVAGAELLIETLARIGEILPEPQDNAQATLAPILKKEDGLIDWRMNAGEIHNRIRGFQPWPGGYTTFRGSRFTIASARVEHVSREPGLLSVENKRLLVGCGTGSLELLEVQPENKKKMAAAAFLNGAQIAASGERVGE